MWILGLKGLTNIGQFLQPMILSGQGDLGKSRRCENKKKFHCIFILKELCHEIQSN